MRFLLILLGLLSVAGTCFARIGETFDECKKRYGEPDSVDKETGHAIFVKAQMLIKARFKAGVCEKITFGREEILDDGTPQPMTSEEIAQLMKVNEKEAWANKDFKDYGWICESWGANYRAQYSLREQALTIWSKAAFISDLQNASSDKTRHLRNF